MLDRSECQKPSNGVGGGVMLAPGALNSAGVAPKANFRLGIRSSKFRHVYGAPSKKQHCYENVKITRNAHDSNFCAVNPKFLAVVVEVGGGGSFLVLPLDRCGRVDHSASKVCGHSRQVLDVKWNPFNDNIIASGSEDCTVKLWYIPDGGLVSDLTEHLVDLQGHRRRVMYLEWHPTAENILLSAGYDHQIFVWNIARGQAVNVIDCHDDTIYSMSFNRNGSLLATTCKDKMIRIIDPRTGEVLRQGDSHRGTKASKVVYLGDTGRLFTTGFSKFSDRQYAVWSQNDLSQPLTMEIIDSSSGVLFPYYDHDTRIVFVAGKGDGNVRYYEVTADPPHAFYLSQFISGAPQRGFGAMPKRGCDTSRCEIFRFYKLHATRDAVEPIAMIVPRKSEVFQDDIYPETAAPKPSLSAEDWLSGQNAFPLLMSLKSGTRIRTFKPVVYKPSENAIVVSDRNNDRKFMFLSEETKPDYRPVDRRPDVERQSARIDHRPLGAESYAKDRENSTPVKLVAKKSYERDSLNGTKFQDVHSKWLSGTPGPGPAPTRSPEPSALEQEMVSSHHSRPIFTSGSTPVKSLTGKFSNGNGHHEEGEGGDSVQLRALVTEQKREIEGLRLEVATRDRRISTLEEQVRRLSTSPQKAPPATALVPERAEYHP